jgi:hypothetical protein
MKKHRNNIGGGVWNAGKLYYGMTKVVGLINDIVALNNVHTSLYMHIGRLILSYLTS